MAESRADHPPAPVLGSEDSDPQRLAEAVQASPATGVSIVVHSGDFDKLMAAFIIATGAATSGKEVTMFFTFWGLNAIKNGKRMPGKSWMDRMVGRMSPSTVDGAPCSRMNMFGIAPRFFRLLMKRKNVTPLGELVGMAQGLGIRLVACQMSMDIMGVRKAELLDDVDYGGVATYLKHAGESGLNLFI